MKINKNSWHYKLVDHFDHDVVYKLIYNKNVTLCQYFWSVVGALIKAGIVVAGAGVLIAAVLLSLYGLWCSVMYLLLPLTGPILNYRYYEIGFGVLPILLFPVVVTAVCATIWGPMKAVPDWMKSNKPEAEYKQPSLLWSWIKAKKDKVCPLIKLEEK